MLGDDAVASSRLASLAVLPDTSSREAKERSHSASFHLGCVAQLLGELGAGLLGQGATAPRASPESNKAQLAKISL